MKRTLAIATIAGLAAAANAQVVVKEGDALAGSTVTGVNAPFTNGNGQVGFVVNLEDGRRGIWYDTGLIFTSDEPEPDVSLSGGESTMGIGNMGEFIYSPSFTNNIDGVGDGDSVWGEDGLIQGDNIPAAGFPGFNITFSSRPQMIDDGTSYWVSGLNDGAGGTSSQRRAFYRRTQDGTITPIFAGDEMFAGITLASGSSVDFDYHVSGDGSSMINVVNEATGSTLNDGRVIVNGVVVASEASPSGAGDNWDNFDIVSTNNAGNYVFSGDTDGDFSVDEFIAYNGVIGLREGDMIGAGELDGSVDALSLNNLNQAAYIWDIGTTESLIFASDASDLSGTSAVLLAVGDVYEGFIIDDFNASAGLGPGLDLAEDGLIYVEVDMTPVQGGEQIEAVIGLAVPAPGAASLLALAGLAAARRRR